MMIHDPPPPFQWCVDATRAGNLAHMLNHSCDPSCFSRTVTIRRAGQEQALSDHVIIIAKVG